MAISTNRIINDYISRLKSRVELSNAVEQEIKLSMGDLIGAIIDEIKSNGEIISDNVAITNPAGLIAGTYPVTGATVGNAGTVTGKIQ